MISDVDILVKDYAQRLTVAGVPKAHQEAVWIIENIFGNKTEIDQKQKQALDEAIRLRERRMPCERIFGSADFCGLSLRVDKEVFKPYSETEDFVHYASMFAEEKKSLRILDLGTGTGCVLLALLRILPQASGVGIDINRKALEVAHENAKTNGLLDRAEFRIGNWSEEITETFDMVVSNPPRAPTSDIPHLLPEMRDYDPPLSLDGGKDGLEFIRKIAKDFGRLSNEGAHCLCQIGPSQASMSDLIFRDAGFRDIEIKGNYFGAPCCIVVKKTIRRCAGRCLLKKLKEVFHSNRNNMVKI